MAGALSIGQMQLLAIARALSMNARIILMDEPTSSLFDDAAERLFRLIADLKQRGVSIVYVSHKMDEIFRICDRVTVLRDGETIGTRRDRPKPPRERTDPHDGGRELQCHAARRSRAAGATVLRSRVSNLTTAKLHERFVRTAPRRSARHRRTGRPRAQRIGRRAVRHRPNRERRRIRLRRQTRRAPLAAATPCACGIGLLPEDRKLQGLMMQMSVLENSTLAVLPADADRSASSDRRQEMARGRAGLRGNWR